MGKIVVGNFVSLDGIVDAPEKWTFPYYNDEVGAHIGANTMASDALLLGRVTYEAFAATFAHQSGGQADVMNNFPKYVVSKTLKTADWNNTTLIDGNAVNVIDEIAKLRQTLARNITISGSASLVHSLMEHNLIDEYSLMIFPVVLGTGVRLFPEGMTSTLKLIESRPFKSGVVMARYEPAQTE